MQKITYPRPCPTCRKSFSKGHFFQHKKEMRYNRKSSEMPGVLLNFWIQTRYVTTCKTVTFEQPIAFSIVWFAIRYWHLLKASPYTWRPLMLMKNHALTAGTAMPRLHDKMQDKKDMRRVHGLITREPSSILQTIYFRTVLLSVLYGILVWGSCSPCLLYTSDAATSDLV